MKLKKFLSLFLSLALLLTLTAGMEFRAAAKDYGEITKIVYNHNNTYDYYPGAPDYQWGTGNVITVFYQDGKVMDYEMRFGATEEFGGSLYYNQYHDVINPKFEGSPDDWKTGQENTFTVTVNGVSAKVKVNLTETPVQSVQCSMTDGFTLIENRGGYMGDDFYCYNFRNIYGDHTSLTVNYKDGTSEVLTRITGEGIWVDSEGREKPVKCAYNENSEPLTTGVDYSYALSYLGVSAQIPFRIIKNPIKAISYTAVQPIYVYEGLGCEETKPWESSEQYAYYTKANPYAVGNYVDVTYTDNSTKRYTCVFDLEDRNDLGYKFVSKDGEKLPYQLEFDYMGSQSAEKPWVKGGDNQLTVSLLDVKTTVPVEVRENDITAAQFSVQTPITIPEHLHGCYHIDSFLYFSNAYYSQLFKTGNTLKLTHQNGADEVYTVLGITYGHLKNYGDFSDYWMIDENGQVVNYALVSYAGGWHHFYDSESSEYNRKNPLWVLGGENYITLTLAGFEQKIPVTITPEVPITPVIPDEPQPQPPTPVNPQPQPQPEPQPAPSVATVKPALSKVKAAKKAANVTWKAVAGATQYEVQYATNKKFKKAKKKIVSGKTALKLKKLKKGKKYFIRVRAINGAEKSKWSKTKSVKVK